MIATMTPDRVEPLERHAEWRAADVADASMWTHHLTDSEIAELESALAFARTATDDVLDVGKEHFPLPTFASVLVEMADELINGRGFHRICGLPVDRLGFDDASWIYWGIGMHLGIPWAQNARGHLLGDVKDAGKSPDDPNIRGYEMGGSALGFHSDGSDLVGLLCLDPGIAGGESLISNALLCHNLLAESDPELAAVLYEGLPYDYRGEQPDGGKPYYHIPAFTRHGDRLFIRYIPQFVLASQRHDTTPRLTEMQLAAMKAYSALVDDPEHWVEMRFQPGDMQFVNNYHVLHGRREYEDDPEHGQVRWLKRLWLATDTLAAEERPERFQPTGALSHWSAKRTKA
ncbi:MAG: TauD/TfdA family dioxygenase [Acidimicrobiales bacterium]